MQIGFTSTSFRQIRDVKKVVELAVTCGADCIEWGGDVHVRSTKDAAKVKKLCDEAKIGISSYGSYYRVGSGKKEEWLEICKIAHAMGAKVVRVWLGKADSEKTDEATYKAIVSDAKAMCAVAEQYGLIVCPECHDKTYNNNTDAFLKIREDIACDNFKTYFQSRYRRMEYDLDRLERTKEYIVGIHVSFSEQVREQLPKLNLGYIDSIFDKIAGIGFDGYLLVEYTYLFSHIGIPSCMKKDIGKLRERFGEKK